MTKEELSKLSINEIKKLYKEYLKSSHIADNTVNTRFAEAFYLTRHTDIDFLGLLLSDSFVTDAKNEIKNALLKNSKTKDVQKAIATHYGHLNNLRCFLLGDESIRHRRTVNRITRKPTLYELPAPTTTQVIKYLDEWDKLEKYTAQEEAINKLFLLTYPKNEKIEEVLAKVAILNDFYSTNIFSTYPVAKHIVELNIDERLKLGDLSLVADIASVDIKGNTKTFYSFATKYCSHHNELVYPICDDYVKKVLIYFRNKYSFSNFVNGDLTNYPKFVNIIYDFIHFFELKDFSVKEIDKYLWLLGKEYLPKNYKKQNNKTVL